MLKRSVLRALSVPLLLALTLALVPIHFVGAQTSPTVTVDAPSLVYRGVAFDLDTEATNPADGATYSNVRFDIILSHTDDLTGSREDVFTITHVDQSEDTQGVNNTFSLEGGDLVGYWGPYSGFPMSAPYEADTTFTVVMNDTTPAPTGDYTVTVELVDVNNGDAVLATDSATFTVAQDPVVTVACPETDVCRAAAFDITSIATNPADGAQVDSARFRITLEGPCALEGAREDTFTVTHVDGNENTQGVNDTFSLVSGDLVGYWGPADGFPMPATGDTADTTFTVQLNGTSPCFGGTYTVTVDLIDLDNGNAVLASASDTFTVTMYPEGDVNQDGETNIIDAMFVAQYTVGLRDFDCDQLVCGDTNDDDETNIIDAMHIAQFTVDPSGAGDVLFEALWDSDYDEHYTIDPLTLV